MNVRTRNSLFFLLSLVVCAALYWPALHGTPIWDDFAFWFKDPVMRPDFSYLSIWKDFSWPVSVSIQKVLFGQWKENYVAYHVLNLFIHFLNSVLVYHLGKRLSIKWPFVLYLLFLFHPSNVISVAWMVQLKTLLCLLFALSSVLTYLKGSGHRLWFVLSWIFFFLSVASKSSSLPLPLVLLILGLAKERRGQWYFLIPYFLIALLAGQRLLSSNVTKKGVESATEIAIGEPVEQGDVESVIDKLGNAMSISESQLSSLPLNFSPFVLKTLHYYFWEGTLPLSNEPVKGINLGKAGVTEYVHLIFLLLIAVSLWKDRAFYWLLSAHVLLLPFLGIIPAPFMNITWVSDQHLYLVLPALLGFWLKVLEKVPWKRKVLVPVFVTIFFTVQTAQSTPYYKDQFAFYESVLREDPYNVPIVYNLAFAYLTNSRWSEGYNLLDSLIQSSQKDPSLKENRYWPHIIWLYLLMRNALEDA